MAADRQKEEARRNITKAWHVHAPGPFGPSAIGGEETTPTKLMGGRAMTIGAGLFLIAVGAILRFGISTVSTHGIAVHTIGDILMAVGVLGVLLWLVVWAPWARSRRTAYRREVPPDEEVVTRRRYPADRSYEDEYPR